MALDVAELFRRHHEPLFLYLVRLTGDGDLAADATQEAFKRMIEKQPKDTEPRAWLYTVATRYARESARTRNRRAELAEGARDRIAPDPPPDPERLAEARRAQRIVREALDTLPERDRTVLLMREEGFAHREIAGAVGTTTGSVGTMIARALARLADVLDAEAAP